MQHNPSIQSNQSRPPLLHRRGKQRININFFNPTLFCHQLAKPNEDLLQRCQIHRFTPPYSLKRGIDPGLLHHPSGKSGIQGGKS